MFVLVAKTPNAVLLLIVTQLFTTKLLVCAPRLWRSRELLLSFSQYQLFFASLGARHIPLKDIKNDYNRHFEVINSSLSEFGVLGFELGYSLEGFIVSFVILRLNHLVDSFIL